MTVHRLSDTERARLLSYFDEDESVILRTLRELWEYWPDEPWAPKFEPLRVVPVVSLDDVAERYGTSGELEVRGYWMPIDEGLQP